MKKKAKLFMGIIFLLLCTIPSVHAETFKSSAADWRPFFFNPATGKKGIVGDIIDEIGKITGDSFIQSVLPLKRMKMLFKKGLLDMEGACHPSWRSDQADISVYTISFGPCSEVIMALKEKAFTINSEKDLRGKRLGTILGYTYPDFEDDFEKGLIHREDVRGEDLLVKKIYGGRVDAAIIGKEAAFYWIKALKLDPNRVTIIRNRGVHELYIRLHKNKAHAVDRFNKAIKQLKKNGKIKEIYEKYR